MITNNSKYFRKIYQYLLIFVVVLASPFDFYKHWNVDKKVYKQLKLTFIAAK